MTASSSATLPDHRVMQQAAEWFATITDEAVTEQQKIQWQAWLDHHPEHQRAWRYVERVGQRFQQAQQQAGQHGAGRILDATRRERLSRRKVIGGGLACVTAWLGWRYTPLPAVTHRIANRFTTDHHTGTGETRQLTLADGGQLWLNTASAVDILYRDKLREITLHNGEILIQTARDPQQRPFVVTTPQGTLQALGTRFTVQQRDTDTLLAVYQGAVKISTVNGNTRELLAGKQTAFSANSIQTPNAAQRSREAWARGLIVADNIPLKDLVAELARYRHGHLGIDPAIADLTVMGTYPIDKPDHALAMLENALPVRVNRTLPWWATLVPDK